MMQDPQEDGPYNGKVLLAAVICLSVVVLFVILLHAYGRWLLSRSRAAETNIEVYLHQRRSTAEEEAAVPSSRDIGLDATLVAALPEFVYHAREQQGKIEDCMVCLSAMEEGEKGRMLPSCGHGFHAWCIDVWLRAHSTCPICRARLAAPAEAHDDVLAVVESREVLASRGVSEVVVEMPVRAGQDDSCLIGVKEEGSSSSSTPSSCSSSLVSCSLKRMLSRTRSDKRVFLSVL